MRSDALPTAVFRPCVTAVGADTLKLRRRLGWPLASARWTAIHPLGVSQCSEKEFAPYTANSPPGYRRIADYLLNHYQDAAFMTAAEIARIVDVDTALVVRFAQRLGYPGFPELINEVQEEVKRDLRAVYEPPEGDNSPAQVYRRNLMQDRNNLDYSLLHFEAETVECVVKVLKEARRIFVAGEGNLTYLCEAFAARLVSLGYAAHPVSQELAGQAAMSVTLGAR